jgi:hypothetical protein
MSAAWYELPNLLKFLEPIDLTVYPSIMIFPVLAGFRTFWNHFHTRIHTPQSGVSHRFEDTGKKDIAAHDSPLS